MPKVERPNHTNLFTAARCSSERKWGMTGASVEYYYEGGSRQPGREPGHTVGARACRGQDSSGGLCLCKVTASKVVEPDIRCQKQRTREWEDRRSLARW